jgi:hypothetical protein
MIQSVLVDQLVDLQGGDSWPNMPTNFVHQLRIKLTSDSHLGTTIVAQQ